jgi:PPP family 3-phenylpropionic acid transporter
MATDNNDQEKLRPAVPSLGFFGTYFFFFMGIGVLLPYLYVFLRDYRGISAAVVGSITLLAPIVVLITQPLWGMLGDLTGKPVFIIQLTSLLAGISVLLMRITPAGSWGWYFLLVPLFFSLQSAVDPLINAAAVHVEYHSDDQGKFGQKRLWGSVGFVVGNLVSALASGWMGLEIIFLIYPLVMIALSLQVLMLKGVKMAPVSPLELLTGLKRALKSPRYRWMLIFFVAWGIPFGGNSVAFGWLWSDLGGEVWKLGYLWMLAAVFEIPLYMLTVRFRRYLSLRVLLIVSGIVPVLRWFFYIIIPVPWMLYYVQPLHSLMFVCFSVGSIYMVDKLSDPVIRSTGQGLLAACVYGFGAAVGNFLAGNVYHYFGPDVFYFLLIVINIVGVGVVLFKFKPLGERAAL